MGRTSGQTPKAGLFKVGDRHRATTRDLHTKKKNTPEMDRRWTGRNRRQKKKKKKKEKNDNNNKKKMKKYQLKIHCL
jgi:hypothetical protein